MCDGWTINSQPMYMPLMYIACFHKIKRSYKQDNTVEVNTDNIQQKERKKHKKKNKKIQKNKTIPHMDHSTQNLSITTRRTPYMFR